MTKLQDIYVKQSTNKNGGVIQGLIDLLDSCTISDPAVTDDAISILDEGGIDYEV